MAGTRRNIVVRVKTTAGTWEHFGSDLHATGVIPEHVQLVSDRYGSKTASFDLRRDPIFMWPDLQAFSPVEVEIDGVLVWSGRIKETPARLDPNDGVISVQAEGWQFHMDDDPYWKRYVHTRRASFTDMRSAPNSSLGNAALAQAGTVSNEHGAITIGFPAGTTAAVGQHVGVVFDLGPENTAKRVVVTWEAFGTDANQNFYVRGSNYPDNNSAAGGGWGAGNYEDAFSPTLVAGPTTSAGTFTTSRRYVQMFMYRGAGTGATAADTWVRIKSVQVFTATAYESGNASVLKASDVLKDGLPHAPLLDQSTDLITTTSFSIPDLSPEQYQTFREYSDAVNVFHDYVLMVDVRKRVVFEAKPTIPRLEAGAWSGYEFEDASSNSGADLYNKVLVQGTGPDGTPLTATSSTTDSLITRQGFTRTKVLSVDAALTTTTAQQIGDTYLGGHQDIPFKGTITVVGAEGLRDAASGASVPPERALLMTNELIRLTDQINPDTGAVGREGRIAEVAYDADEDQAALTLDNTRANFEALLARYSVVVGANVQS